MFKSPSSVINGYGKCNLFFLLFKLYTALIINIPQKNKKGALLQDYQWIVLPFK